jgi:hypothetical protein
MNVHGMLRRWAGCFGGDHIQQAVDCIVATNTEDGSTQDAWLCSSITVLH